ncbi:MAG: hypothetical protein EZS28_041865, partial [Streblomastix strix]
KLKEKEKEIRNLPNIDITGSADPFVIISLGGEEKQTKVIKNARNADFNDEITLPFDPISTQDREMKIEVWDYDPMSNDNLIGTTSIPV